MSEPRQLPVLRDLEQIRRGSAATAEELRDFMKTLKGRSPAEVLGAVAQSSLVQSTVLATIGCVVIMAAGTVIPWALAKGAAKKPAAVATVPTVEKAATPAETAATAPTAAESSGPPASGDLATPKPTAEPPVPSDDLLEKFGVGEAKETDPNTNPLDKPDDDLLKGIQ